MRKCNKVYEELIKRKPYLLEENSSPNIGYFEYGKSKNIENILRGVNTYRYDIYRQKTRKGKIYSLGGGDPIDYKMYKYVKKDINKCLRTAKLSQYPHTIGNKKVKEKVLDYLDSIDIKNIGSEELLITPSTTYAYSLLINSIVRRYDVVLIPTPTYGLFVYGPEKAGGRVEYIELDEKNNWTINLEELSTTIDRINNELKETHKDLDYVPRVVAIYHQNPHNPLGISLGKTYKTYLNNLNKICYEKNVLIIDDLVYRDSVYNDEDIALPLATMSKYKDNIITLMGISKSYSLAGIRAGVVFGNKYIIQDLRDNIFVNMDSVSLITQVAIASIFNNDKKRVKYRNKFLKGIKKKYQYNLDIIRYFIEGAQNISNRSKRKIEKKLSKEEISKYENGMKYVTIYNNLIPASGFFILIDFTKIKGKKISIKKINNDIDLVLELYKKDKIKFLPGSSFCWNNKEQLIGRFTFSKPSNELIDTMKALSNVINNLSN